MNDIIPTDSFPVAIAEQLARWSQSAQGSFSPETERAWRQDTKSFRDFCLQLKAPMLPAAPATVAAYARAQGEEHALATVKRRLATIARFHKAAALPDPTKAEEVRNAVRALARARKTNQRHAAPLHLRDVDRIADRIESPNLRELRDLAMLRVGYALLTRANELASITVESVRFQEDGTALVDLLRRKTTDSTRPYPLNREAVQALRAWLDAAQIKSGPVFVKVSAAGTPEARPLTRSSISRTFKTLAKRAGLEAREVSSHSLRRGMTQDLLVAGHDIGAIAHAGGWKTTTMPLRYAEDLLASDNAVAQYFRKLNR